VFGADAIANESELEDLHVFGTLLRVSVELVCR
jgi:hypothetical protein